MTSLEPYPVSSCLVCEDEAPLGVWATTQNPDGSYIGVCNLCVKVGRMAAENRRGKNIVRTPVNSSNIKSVGYDEGKRTLVVEFYTGGIYEYKRVPLRVYDELMAADSVGSYLSAHIKGRYDTVKLP